MGLLKNFFNDNSTVVGLCDLTQKTTNELYEITSKEIPTKKIKTSTSKREVKIEPKTIREAQIQSQVQPKATYNSNPFSPKSFVEVQKEVSKTTQNTSRPEIKTINSITSI